MRLIDADELLKAYEGRNNFLGAVLVEAPTIDAVPVIRCKDCAKNRTDDCSMHFEDEEKVYEWNEEIDFCSWGKRKEE